MKTFDAFIEVYMLPAVGAYLGGKCGLYRIVPVGATVPTLNREPDYVFNCKVYDVKLLRLDHAVSWYIGCWPKPLNSLI